MIMKKKAVFKKHKGEIEIIVPVFFLILAVIIVACLMQLQQFNATKTFVEDSLAASNLASAVIDAEEYGISHNVVITDPQNAYSTYQRALKANMGLNDAWESQDKLAIAGKVEILNYIIYNVRGNDVEIISFGESSYSTTVVGGLGSVKAPNDKVIASTSVYSRITFPVEGILNIRVTAEKDELVDIVGGTP